ELRAARGSGGVGGVRAVGWEAGVADGGALVGQTPGPASGERSDPHVVRGGEGDRVTVDVGVAEVRGMGGSGWRRRHGPRLCEGCEEGTGNQWAARRPGSTEEMSWSARC